MKGFRKIILAKRSLVLLEICGDVLNGGLFRLDLLQEGLEFICILRKVKFIQELRLRFSGFVEVTSQIYLAELPELLVHVFVGELRHSRNGQGEPAS